MTNHTPLTADEALVLQQLHEDGEDDTRMQYGFAAPLRTGPPGWPEAQGARRD